MTCRDDSESIWYRHKLYAAEESLLILETRLKALNSYCAIQRIFLQIVSEAKLLKTKLTFCDLLSKLHSSTDEKEGPGKMERIEEVRDQFKNISTKLKAFTIKLAKVVHTLDEENTHWKKFIMEDPEDYGALKRMKMEDRKQLVNKITSCLTLFNSGKDIFENFLDEWDAMKPELDQSVIGCMKELVVIVKEPNES